MRRAFTLLELIVTMGIIAVLAGLTALAFGRIARTSHLSAETNLLTQSLSSARAHAIQTNGRTALVILPEALYLAEEADKELRGPDLLATRFRVVGTDDRRDSIGLAVHDGSLWSERPVIAIVYNDRGQIVDEYGPDPFSTDTPMWVDVDGDGVQSLSEPFAESFVVFALYDRTLADEYSDFSQYVDQHGTRFQFNRYSGLVMR